MNSRDEFSKGRGGHERSRMASASWVITRSIASSGVGVAIAGGARFGRLEAGGGTCLTSRFESGVVAAVDQDAADQFSIDDCRPASARAWIGIVPAFPVPLDGRHAVYDAKTAVEPADDRTELE
jgi:hypothetical protein